MPSSRVNKNQGKDFSSVKKKSFFVSGSLGLLGYLTASLCSCNVEKDRSWPFVALFNGTRPGGSDNRVRVVFGLDAEERRKTKKRALTFSAAAGSGAAPRKKAASTAGSSSSWAAASDATRPPPQASSMAPAAPLCAAASAARLRHESLHRRSPERISPVSSSSSLLPFELDDDAPSPSRVISLLLLAASFASRASLIPSRSAETAGRASSSAGGKLAWHRLQARRASRRARCGVVGR